MQGPLQVCTSAYADCERGNYYSAQFSEEFLLKGGVLGLEPRDRSVFVFVPRRSVWSHSKPIETPASYSCQILIKWKKNV